MSLADYQRSVQIPREEVESVMRQKAEEDEKFLRWRSEPKGNSVGPQPCVPAADDLSELFFAALSSAMEREGWNASVLVGRSESGRALPWREEYQTFGNGRRLEEAEAPPFCGADVPDAPAVLVRAQAAAVAKAAKERRAVALVFRRGVVCQLERRAASFEPPGLLADELQPPVYRAPGVYVRTRVAFVRLDSRVGE